MKMEQSSGAKKRRVKEDRISTLPDPLLHHILSFLPSTEEAIRTGILSKRWRNQWTRVPVLIFDSGKYSDDSEDFARFIDGVLLQHECSKIKKLQLGYSFEMDTNFSSKIRFAMARHVEELILNYYFDGQGYAYLLPDFLFDNASLVKLELCDCDFRADWSVNWGSLKVFKMVGFPLKRLVKNVLDGSPSLESLHLNDYGRPGTAYTIASKLLKILVLEDVAISDVTRIEISCPNLKQFSIRSSGECTEFPVRVIENVVSGCPFLRLLELERYNIEEKLVIASKSLKKLVLSVLFQEYEIEVSCPNLEEFNSSGIHKLTFNLMNNFETSQYGGCHEDKAKQIFKQLRSVVELTIESWYIKILSDVEMRGRSYKWLRNTILTLDGPNFEHFRGIVCALRSSPALQRLVIKLQVYERRLDAKLLDLSDSGENDWNSNGTVVKCLLSHLKIVEIVGLSKQDAKCTSVLNFIGFLIKNARVLEKLVLVISKDGGMGFAFEVYQRVSSFPRYSRSATVSCCVLMSSYCNARTLSINITISPQSRLEGQAG